MFEFHAGGGGALDIAAAFALVPYANISFFDADRADILLHVSLRADQGIAVFNRRAGGVWGAERPVPLPPGDGPQVLTFRFGEGGVRVALGAETLFDLSPSDVPGAERIGWHEITGGFDPASLVLDGIANRARQGLGGLVHAAPFGIAGWGLDPGLARQDVTLDFGGLAEAPQMRRIARPDLAPAGTAGTAPVAVELELPGRVWADLAPQAPLVIQLRANGQPCGAPLTLTRSGFGAALDLLLQQPGMDPASRSAILALEHVQHGGFWPDLGTTARATLRGIAQAGGLQDLLPASDRPPLPPALPALDYALSDQAFADLSAAYRAAPAQDPLALLDTIPPLPLGARRKLYLQLTDLFCAQGRFDALYARAAADGLSSLGDLGEGWQRSIHLPYLLASGQTGRLRDALWQVAGDDEAWISTAAVGWVMGEICNPARDLPKREELIYPFLDLLTRRAANYWGRATCVQLQGAMLRLLAFAPHLPDWMTPRLIHVALQVHGLSPGFWARVAQALAGGTLAAHPLLHAGQAAFRTISQQAQGQEVSPAALEAALALFETQGAVDAPRIRRELLGPLGLDAATGPGQDLVLRLTAQDGDLGLTALRALAFPADPSLLPDVLAEDLAPLLRQSVATAHWGLPHAPLHGLQADVSRRIAALLDGSARSDAPRLDALFGDLATLAQDRGLGLALAVALVDGLLRQGQEAPIADLVMRIDQLLYVLPADAQEALTGQPAVQNAVAALLARNGAQPLALGLAQRLGATAPAALPAAASPTLDTSPLFDALVIVVSCRPYLDTRIPALRAAWLDRLAALGVPWVVAVGGGTGPARMDGHVLQLECPDDYEGLPQKVLAAFDWAARHSPAAHVLKIDDDCFLDAQAFFHAQSWRKFAYYGRKLTLAPGQMDRAWHQAKSTSARGRLELDKSPEPSTYCDGGSGYVLSRQALTALADQAATSEGQRLILSSFMEDKLVGDLLARAGITPEDEDHLVAVRRKGKSGGIAVSVWANSFLPSAATGIKLAHLDDVTAQGPAAALQGRAVLWPPKIWPSYAPVKLLSGSNLLELVSPVPKLQALNAAPLAVVAAFRNEMFMLPHFLAHYRALGVQAFLVADNLSDDGTLEFLAEQPDVAVFSVDSDYRGSQYGVAWQQAILSNLRVGRWSLMADADELLVKGEGFGLDAVLAEPEADAVRIFMLDMYPRGALAGATFRAAGPFEEAGYCDAAPFLERSLARGPFGDQPTWTSALRHRLIPNSRPELFVAQKIALLKYQPWMRLSAGLHYVGDVRLAAQEMIFAHFKYNAEFAGKVRAEVARRQHFNDAEEYRRYQALLQEGREVIFDEGLSRPWADCAAVRRILRRA